MSPRVSVITPVWNAATTLAATVASVQAQTFTDWDMHLIDDGSQDSSRALANTLVASDSRLHVHVLAQNSGAAIARNTGIRAAQGQFIAFLDADDLWRPEKLELQVAALDGPQSHPFVFSGYQRMSATNTPLEAVQVPPRVTYAQLLKGNVIGCLTAIYDTQVLGKIYMPEIRRRQDYGLWLRLLKHTPHALGLPDILADYRVGASSLSSNRLAAARFTWKLYRDIEGLSAPHAAWCLTHNLLHGLRKRL